MVTKHPARSSGNLHNVIHYCYQAVFGTGVDKGGRGPSPPPNGRGKKIFFVKIEGLTLCLHQKGDSSVTDILTISKITWNYVHFSTKFVKIFTVSRASNDPQQLSLAQASLQLIPVVYVTITQREQGTSIRCPTGILVLYSLFNWNSKVLFKNLVHKGANFEAQNALKLTYQHV